MIFYEKLNYWKLILNISLIFIFLKFGVVIINSEYHYLLFIITFLSFILLFFNFFTFKRKIKCKKLNNYKKNVKTTISYNLKKENNIIKIEEVLKSIDNEIEDLVQNDFYVVFAKKDFLNAINIKRGVRKDSLDYIRALENVFKKIEHLKKIEEQKRRKYSRLVNELPQAKTWWFPISTIIHLH